MQKVIGWDIGGAHVKAACDRGRTCRRGPATTLPALAGRGSAGAGAGHVVVGVRCSRSACRHDDRRTGRHFPGPADRRPGDRRCAGPGSADARTLRLYGGRSGIIAPAQRPRRTSTISPPPTGMRVLRWRRATATGCSSISVRPRRTSFRFATARCRRRGYTDAERLACGELVYTGLTPQLRDGAGAARAVCRTWTTLAAEYFASAADVHRILGTLDEAADQMDTADGRPKTAAASRARLARMIGHDAADASRRRLARAGGVVCRDATAADA